MQNIYTKMFKYQITEGLTSQSISYFAFCTPVGYHPHSIFVAGYSPSSHNTQYIALYNMTIYTVQLLPLILY